jgi:hypothetical protein
MTIAMFGTKADGTRVPIPVSGHGVRAHFTTQAAVGPTAVLDVGVVKDHGVQVVVAGTPTAGNYLFQGSQDGVNFFDVLADLDCTVDVHSVALNVPVGYVRGYCNSFAGTALKITSIAVSNANLAFWAQTAGSAGNDITIAYIDPEEETATETVVVSGVAISITLRSVSTVLSTASQVRSAVVAHSVATALVATSPAGTGAGVVTALSAFNLAGGGDVTLHYAGM